MSGNVHLTPVDTSVSTERERLAEMTERLVPNDPFDEKWWHDPALRAYWISLDSMRCVGLVVVQQNATIGKDFNAPMPILEGSMYLMLVGVIPDERRKGYATQALLKYFEIARRKGAKKVVSNIRESNAESEFLHLATGFALVERIANFYPDPREDTLVFERKL